VARTEDLVASYMDWMTLSSTDEEFADDIARTLKPNLKFYPEQSRIDAQCITLLKMCTEVSEARCSCKTVLVFPSYRDPAFQEPMLLYTEAKAVEEGKEAIKGPVSQYNFFSMESRKLIRDSSRDCEVCIFSLIHVVLAVNVGILTTCTLPSLLQMSNNEWNRLVGKRWRELTAREHEPFKQMALQDKKRYEAVSRQTFSSSTMRCTVCGTSCSCKLQ
jgi:hypothetical protein